MHLSTRITAFTLLVLLATASAQAAELKWQATPLYGTVNLSAGFTPDPNVTTIKAGGTTDAASAVGGDCRGFVNAEAPDVDLNYSAGGHSLYIYATSSADTTLVVFDANGRWHCNDDYSSESGTNPGIHFSNPPSGNYNIWVGTYDNSGNTPDANVAISELGMEWSTSTKSAASSAPSGNRSSQDSSDINWGDDSSQWSHDGECDDPRFEGPGAHHYNIEADRFHDATDCRTLYEQGQLHMVE